MKLNINNLLPTRIISIFMSFLMSGCGVRIYNSYPVPLSVITQKENVLIAGAGMPHQIEYQRKIGDKVDIITGSSIVVSRAAADSSNTNDAVAVPMYLLDGFIGLRAWINKPDTNGLGTNYFAGINVGRNWELTTWSQVGLELGGTTMIRFESLTFGLPAKLGMGIGDGTFYTHFGIGLEAVYAGPILGGGMRGLFSYSPTLLSTYTGTLYYHMPISLTGFLIWQF